MSGKPLRAWLLIAICATWSPVSVGQALPAGVPRPEPLPLPSATTSSGERLQLSAPVNLPPAIVLGAPIRVRAFRVVGLSAFPAHEAERVLLPWAGRELGQSELGQALDALNRYLRGRGLLLAQAYAPEQGIREDVLEIRIIEGRIGRVQLEMGGGVRLREATARQFLAGLHEGDSMRRDNVEQSLLLLHDLPGTRLSASLVPSAQPGIADILARMDNEAERPFSAMLAVDNAGLRGIGETRAVADLRYAGPLAKGDLLAVRVLQSSAGGQTLAALTYGMPVNGAGSRLGLRYTAQRYKLGDEFAVLQGQGDYAALSLLFQHPLLRRNDRNLNLVLSHTGQRYQDRLDAIAYSSEVRQDLTGLGLAGDFADNWAGGGMTMLQAHFLTGRLGMGTPAVAAADAALGSAGVQGGFSLLRLRLDHERGVGDASSVSFSINVQLASRNLHAGNDLGVGGPDGVRAYPVGELFADQGFTGRVELRRELHLVPGQRSIFSVFHDHARVDVHRLALAGDTANRRGFSGYGIGLLQTLAQGMFLQLSSAWRSHGPGARTAADRLPRIWVSLGGQF